MKDFQHAILLLMSVQITALIPSFWFNLIKGNQLLLGASIHPDTANHFIFLASALVWSAPELYLVIQDIKGFPVPNAILPPVIWLAPLSKAILNPPVLSPPAKVIFKLVLEAIFSNTLWFYDMLGLAPSKSYQMQYSITMASNVWQLQKDVHYRFFWCWYAWQSVHIFLRLYLLPVLFSMFIIVNWWDYQ